jgi:hypothetical protein
MKAIISKIVNSEDKDLSTMELITEYASILSQVYINKVEIEAIKKADIENTSEIKNYTQTEMCYISLISNNSNSLYSKTKEDLVDKMLSITDEREITLVESVRAHIQLSLLQNNRKEESYAVAGDENIVKDLLTENLIVLNVDDEKLDSFLSSILKENTNYCIFINNYELADDCLNNYLRTLQRNDPTKILEIRTQETV